MGRDAGFLAQNCAIACGAEAAIVPEETTDVDQLAAFMGRGIRKSKKSCIVIVSESPKCGAMYYAERVKKEFPEFDVRVSILGHLQRPHSGQLYRCWCYRSHFTGSEKRYGWRAQQRRGVCALLGVYTYR